MPSRETDPAPMYDACEVSTQSQEVEHFFHDGTERLIQRPKDPQTQRAYYSEKEMPYSEK